MQIKKKRFTPTLMLSYVLLSLLFLTTETFGRVDESVMNS